MTNDRIVFCGMRGRAVLMAGAACAVLLATGRARALETTVDGWQVNVDTTLSSSVDIRTSPINYTLVGVANGGKDSLANSDNGTLNYKQFAPVAATQRITTEVQIKKSDYGLFVRATGFYDPVADSEKTQFVKLSRAAERDIGADARLLDAYIFARPVIFDHPVDVRIGNQAMNWGESTFIQFGINSISAIDVTALRTPGAELRTGLLPIPVVDLKTEVAPNTTLEGFWQFAWTRDKGEPDGSFFSTNDTLTDGGTFANLVNYFPDNPQSVYGIAAPFGGLFGASIPRSLDRHPTSLAEFGFALRTTVPSLNDTEFGLYYENYNSRIPFGSFRTGLPQAVLPNPITLLFTAGGYAASTYNSTASYFADYPSEIHLIGFSWNFTGPHGIAFQGELSNRLNQPLQLAASDLSLATEVPAIGLALRELGPLPSLEASLASALADPTIQALNNGLSFNDIIDGWKRYPVTQIQQTATKIFTAIPHTPINSITAVGEIGFDYVHNFPRDRGIFDVAYTTNFNSAYAQAATVDGIQRLSTKGLASQLSGAYTVAVIFDMPNLLPDGIDMKPILSLQHDFVGTSPYGVNNFTANTAAASVGVSFQYLQAWNVNVQYTNHFPIFDGGKFYGLIDRDFASATVSYEF